MNHEDALRLALASDNKAGSMPATWTGRWTNQIGSTMDLQVTGNSVEGSYTSASKADGTGSVTGPLKGYVAGDLLSFSVLWPGGSMTAWTGQLVDEGAHPRIKTLWHLVTDVPDADEPKRLWTSTFTGADEFVR